MNIETLAEIRYTASRDSLADGHTIASWAGQSERIRRSNIAGMQAAMDAYLGSIGEGFPSVEEIIETLQYKQTVRFWEVEPVRNLLLAAFAKKTTGLQQESDEYFTKLAAIAKLPEEWRKCSHMYSHHWNCAEELDKAISPLLMETIREMPADPYAHLKAAFAAGKLTDEQLGEIGARAACNAMGGKQLLVVDAECGLWEKVGPGRTAFARSVREAVERESNDRFNRSCKDYNEEIARLTAELDLKAPIKLPAQAMGDGTEAGVCSVFARGWNGFHHEFIKLNPGIRIMRECLSSDHRYKTDLAGVERRAKELEAELVKTNAELERLRWQGLDVTPTAADGDANNCVTCLFKDGTVRIQCLTHPFSNSVTHWRPFCPPPAPTAQEKEREEFEAAYREAYPNHIQEAFEVNGRGDYIQTYILASFEGWKLARASKGAKS